MGVWDWIILGMITTAVAAVLIRQLRKKNTGGCSGNCANCPHCKHE